MFNLIRARMNQDRQAPAARREARLALRRAELWGTLGGQHTLGVQNEGQHEGLEEAIAISEELIFDYPRTVQVEMDHRRSLAGIHREQAVKTCMDCEVLLSLSYLQKTRLEGQATRDNWARDALGPVSRNIQLLEECHRTLKNIEQSAYY